MDTGSPTPRRCPRRLTGHRQGGAGSGRGASNAKNVYGLTPLHVAAESGHTACAELLLDSGAAVDERDRLGRTAWNIAQDAGHSGSGRETEGARRRRDAGPVPGAARRFPRPTRTRRRAADVRSGRRLGLRVRERAQPRGLLTGRERGLLDAEVPRADHVLPKGRRAVDRAAQGAVHVDRRGRRANLLPRRAEALLPVDAAARARRTIGKENVWYVERAGARWSAPRPVSAAVNAFDHHWLFSIASDGTLWFSSAHEGGAGGRDIYYSRLVDNVHQAPRNAGPVINSAADEQTPFIAPDGSYLLFVSRGRGGTGGDFRFFISYRAADGNWTSPAALSGKIEGIQQALCPLVTPDGRFMFFIGQGDIYWTRADFIQAMRPTR